MIPLTKHRYLSVLKFKAGEVAAVRNLRTSVFQKWNPLFELLPDVPTEKSKRIPNTPNKIVEALTDSCGTGATLFLSVKYLRGLGNLREQVEEIFRRIREGGNIPVPVADSASNAEELAAFAGASSKIGGTAAVRLALEDIPRADALLNAISKRTGLKTSESFLILDLGYIPQDSMAREALVLPALLRRVATLGQWKSLTLTGCGLPETVQSNDEELAKYPRTEWELFQSVRDEVSRLTKRLDFGDYTITNPNLVELNPKLMKPSPKLVYTTNTDWLVAKGKSKRGWKQMYALAAKIRDSGKFKGPEFSEGDSQIATCAAGEGTTGNSTTWKQAGTNHHVTLVASQVAKSLA